MKWSEWRYQWSNDYHLGGQMVKVAEGDTRKAETQYAEMLKRKVLADAMTCSLTPSIR